MQSSIAQAVALTIYGNAALSIDLDPAIFYPSNNTFKHCESVTFSDNRRGGSKHELSPYASDPIAWIKNLKSEGVSGLRINYGPSKVGNLIERTTVAFAGGGGRWAIEEIRKAKSFRWEGTWRVNERNRAERRIWQVNYYRLAVSRFRFGHGSGDLEVHKKKLERSLRRILDFARNRKLDKFGKAFESGLFRLESQDPYEGLFHSDIAPPGFLPPSANQLLGAVQAAWVFGGMGSWNDGMYSGDQEKQYDAVSQELYDALNASIIAAANSRMGSAPVV
jgi:hypothetical protein